MKRYPLAFLTFLALACSSCAFLPTIGGTSEDKTSTFAPASGDGTGVTAEEFDNLFNHYGLLHIKNKYGITMDMNFGDYGYAYIYTDGLMIEGDKFNRGYYYQTHSGDDDYSYSLKYRPNGDGTYKEYAYAYDMDGPQDLVQNDHWTFDDRFNLAYLQIGLQLSMFEYTAAKYYDLKETYNFRGEFLGEMVDISLKSMSITFENGQFKSAYGAMSTKKQRSISFNFLVSESDGNPLEEPLVEYKDKNYVLDKIIGIDDKGGTIDISTSTATETYGLSSYVEYVFFADKTYQSVSYVLNKPVGQNGLEYVHGRTEKRLVDQKYSYTAYPEYIKNQVEGVLEADSNSEINIRLQERSLYVPTDVTFKVGDRQFRATYVLVQTEYYKERIAYYSFGNEEEANPHEEKSWARSEQFLVGRFDSPTLASPLEHLNETLLTSSVQDAFIEFYSKNRYYFDKSYNGYYPDTMNLVEFTTQIYGDVDDVGPGATFTMRSGTINHSEDNKYSTWTSEIVDPDLTFVDENTIEFRCEYSYAQDPETNRWLNEEVVWQFHRSI